MEWLGWAGLGWAGLGWSRLVEIMSRMTAADR